MKFKYRIQFGKYVAYADNGVLLDQIIKHTIETYKHLNYEIEITVEVQP